MERTRDGESVRKYRGFSLSSEKQAEEDILPRPQSSYQKWIERMAQQKSRILLSSYPSIKITITLELITADIEEINAESKTKKQEELQEEARKDYEAKSKEKEELKEEAQRQVSPSKKKGVGVFWYSIDAINLFYPDKPANTDVLYEVYRRILLFSEALETADGWLKVAETGMTEADASDYEVKLFGAKIR